MQATKKKGNKENYYFLAFSDFKIVFMIVSGRKRLALKSKLYKATTIN